MQRSPETRRAYANDLRRWEEAGLPLTIDGAIAFRDALEASLAPASAARVWSTVRSYHRWLVVLGETLTSPFEFLKGPRRVSHRTPKVPANSAVDAIFAASSCNPQWRLILALLLNGLREGEVITLTKDAIEDHDGVPVLRVVGKGQKERLVPATIETQQAIVAALAKYNEAETASPWLVPDYDGSQRTGRQVRAAVYKAADYAGVERVNPHAFRHHYATRLIKAGANVLHVKDLLGHASVSTTQVYVTLDLSDLVQAAGLDPRNQQRPAALEEVA
jgi:integrase/recombinase XerD